MTEDYLKQQMTKPYYSVSDFYKKKFGKKVYKITLDAGCTCPTRDGYKDTRGCIFCSITGSGDFTPSRTMTICEQIVTAKEKVFSKVNGRNNNSNGQYIAYFQNFTNTYGDASTLEKKYIEALQEPDIVGIAIGTRPDCISPQILQVFSRLENKFPQALISIELGLQSTKTESINYIRRHYDNAEYVNAIEKIRTISKNIHIVTHIIFGLPGETEKDMLNTIDFCCGKSGIITDGIKISLLHVLKNTDLAKDWEKGLVHEMTMETYFSILGQALERIPKSIVIHRLTGDGPKSLLLSPLWTGNKRLVHNALEKYLLENNIQQGRLFY